MPITIDIKQIGGDENVEPTPPDQMDETLFLALEAPKGVELEFSSEKERAAWRFRFYRRIKAHRAKGVTSFNQLVLSFEDPFKLVIQNLAPLLPNAKVRT